MREEFARTVEDVLARRIRMLFMDARAARESAETVAKVMAKELSKDDAWVARQTEDFQKLAGGYILE